MQEILEMRTYWIIGIVFFGIITPMLIILGWLRTRDRQKVLPVPVFFGIIGYFIFMFSYGQQIIVPKKYHIEYKNVYQCGYVDVMVPKYPDGITEGK